MSCVATAGLSIGDVNNSVISLMGSVSYLKAFIPIAVTNIIHNRIEYDPELFNPHTLNAVPYKTFSERVPKKHPLFNVYHWMRDALCDLDKKYMKALFLIVRKKATEDVIEHYSFSINYTEVHGRPKLLANSEKVMETTSKLFETINLLSEQHKLNESDISFAMQVVLNDSAPDTYITKNFERAQPYVGPDVTGTVSVGTLTTGYHKVKIHAKGKVFNIDDETPSNENFESTEITANDVDKSNMKTKVMEKYSKTGVAELIKSEVIEAVPKEVTEDDDFEKAETYRKPNTRKRKAAAAKNVRKKKIAKRSDDRKKKESLKNDSHSAGQIEIIESQEMKETLRNNISCLCSIKNNIDTILLVMCSLCGKYQHVACVGYRSDASVPQPHVCYFCHSKTGAKISDVRMYNARSENKRLVIAVLRLVSVYCVNTKESPDRIINLIDVNLKQHALNGLLKCGLFQMNNEKIVANQAIITKTLNSVLFYKEIDSMELDPSQVITIDDS